MKAKEFVLSKYPEAIAERFVVGHVYWCIYSKQTRLSQGNTESNAWVNAKAKIHEQEKEKEQCTHCQQEDPVFGMKYQCHCKQYLEHKQP